MVSMGLTTALVAAIIAIPLGIWLGATAWRAVAAHLSFDDGVVVPPILAGALFALPLIAALVLSAIPTRRASPPLAELRPE
jgi:hypothetical protein